GVQLITLGLERLDQIVDLTVHERVPVLLVRVVVRTDPLHRAHQLSQRIEDLDDLLPRLDDLLRDVASLIRIHTLESHHKPLSPRSRSTITAEEKTKNREEPAASGRRRLLL